MDNIKANYIYLRGIGVNHDLAMKNSGIVGNVLLDERGIALMKLGTEDPRDVPPARYERLYRETIGHAN